MTKSCMDWGVYEIEARRILDNQHMKVIRLLALSTGRFMHYPPPLEIILVLFLLEAEMIPGP
jgi:hypothetical protein